VHLPIGYLRSKGGVPTFNSLGVDKREQGLGDGRATASIVIALVSTVMLIFGTEIAAVVDPQVVSIAQVIDILFTSCTAGRDWVAIA